MSIWILIVLILIIVSFTLIAKGKRKIGVLVLIFSLIFMVGYYLYEYTDILDDYILNSSKSSNSEIIDKSKNQTNLKDNKEGKIVSQDSSIINQTTVINSETRIVPLLEEQLGTIYLPPNIIDKEMELKIADISNYDKTGLPEDYKSIFVFEIEIGNIHKFNDLIRIEFKYSDAQIKEEDEESYIGAMYYNESEKKWEYPYYEIYPEDNVIVIFTDHLSKYAMVSNINRKACKPKLLTEDEIIDSIKNIKKEYSDYELVKLAITDLDSAISTSAKFIPDNVASFVINSEVYQFKEFGEMCKYYSRGKLLTKYANSFNYLNKKDSYEKRKAVMDLAKEMYDYGLGMIGEYSSKLAGISNFVIEYSFNKFVDEAIKGNENAWDEMYKEYYFRGEGIRSLTWWRNNLANIINQTYTEEDLISIKIDEFVNKYMNEIWNNEAELASLIQERDKLTISGLSEELKRKIVINNKKQLYETRIIPAIELLKKYNKNMASIEIAKKKAELTNFLLKDKYIDIYYDVPQEFKGMFSMEDVEIVIGNIEIENHRFIDRHQIHYTPINVLLGKGDIKNLKVNIKTMDGVESKIIKLERALPGYNAVHINIPDNYIEFNKTKFKEDKQEENNDEDSEESKEIIDLVEDKNSDEEDENLEEINLNNNEIIFEPIYTTEFINDHEECKRMYISNAKKEDFIEIDSKTFEIDYKLIKEKYYRHKESSWEGLGERITLCEEHSNLKEEEFAEIDIEVYDLNSKSPIKDTKVNINGEIFYAKMGNNTFKVLLKDNYVVSFLAEGYQSYQVKWSHQEAINNFFEIGLLPNEEEAIFEPISLGLDIRDYDTRGIIDFKLTCIDNCEYNSIGELIVTGDSFSFVIEANQYIKKECLNLKASDFKTLPIIRMFLEKEKQELEGKININFYVMDDNGNYIREFYIDFDGNHILNKDGVMFYGKTYIELELNRNYEIAISAEGYSKITENFIFYENDVSETPKTLKFTISKEKDDGPIPWMDSEVVPTP